MRKPVTRALLSVSDKTGLVEVARALAAQDAELVATGTTAETLLDAGLAVTEVSSITGIPEILGGRVKTLHPAIHAPVLAQQNLGRDLDQLERLGWQAFDVVVCNLYPFQETVDSGASAEDCVEMIDIGGPTLLRAAAKNFASVCVLSNPDQYPEFVAALDQGGTTLEYRRNLSLKAFREVTEYDISIANWMGEGGKDWWSAAFKDGTPLRYGENPHQNGTVLQEAQGGGSAGGGVVGGTVLNGKVLSYNNYRDTDAAVRAVAGFAKPAVAIIKHANPSGIATGTDLADAYRKALACDPLSAFGGVVAANGAIDLALAKEIMKVFTEVVVGPEFTEEALALLRTKPALRLLRVDAPTPSVEMEFVSGGLLRQSADTIDQDDLAENWDLVAGKPAGARELEDLEFAWHSVAFTKSNAVLLAKHGASVGIGMGQVSRVDAARLAVDRANTLDEGKRRSEGSAAASDAFFPFPDGLQILIDAGVSAVVAPGGSRGDEAVIDAAKKAGISLYFTKRRHFRH